MRKVTGIVLILTLFLGCSRENGQPRPITPFAMPRFERPMRRVTIEKAFLYDKYTLHDTFPYRDTVRIFQWDKIRAGLLLIDSLTGRPAEWGVVQNRNNSNGEAPLARGFSYNAYKRVQDLYGTERRQSAPLYASPDSLRPERYILDGALVRIMAAYGDSMLRVAPAYLDGTWAIPSQYVKRLAPDTSDFSRIAFVDRTNQNIATLERSGIRWLVRSMNPATTGLHRPPWQQETPLGIFVVQEKKPRMIYLIDGTNIKGGFAPHASRFSNGGYIHGIPVNEPRRTSVEYSPTLGTTPRSHMCVRNATSHAEFFYRWAPVDRSLVFVIE